MIKRYIKKIINLFGENLDIKIYNYFSQKISLQKSRREIIDTINKKMRSEKDIEKKKTLAEIEKYFRTLPMKIAIENYFPYEWANRIYQNSTVEVYEDTETGMKYTYYCKKKLYYPKTMSVEDVKASYVFGQLIEQNENSPHRYSNDKFHVEEGDIIADVGSCEGNFTLENIEKIEKAYIFEVEDKWIECLKKTFEPWKDKVEIVKKYVSNVDSESEITLDTFFKDKTAPTFIKADIEGAEQKMIDGSKETISNKALKKIVLCVYHRPDDEIELPKNFSDIEYEKEFSKDYLFYYDNKTHDIEVTKCLIYITRK